MFSEAISKFQKYVDDQGELDDVMTMVNGEIVHKLMQLDWLIVRAYSLNTEIITGKPPNFSAMGELEIITESFYHFASRLRDLLQNRNPDFKTFECVGVRDVRNHLMVHPEKQKEYAKLVPTFSVSGNLSEGPTIKGYSEGDKSITDKGLFTNAKEFRDNFNAILSKI